MKQSQIFSTTRKEAPAGETSKNAILLTRAGFIDKEMAGVYTLLPLGLRVVEKVKQIVREELNKLPHTSEVLMPSMQPHALWEESGRREGIKEVMYDVAGEPIGLGPTHEEVVVDLFRRFFRSYKDVPRGVYQIQTKFRNEPRAKSGLLRGREFLMKDLYSFHQSEEDFDQYYDLVIQAYFKIFERCGLQAILTEASGGVFSKYSHEFQVLAENGEDTIYLNQAGDKAWNKEIVESESDPELLEFSGGFLDKRSAVEAGNIFPLKDKYSKALGAAITTKDGQSMYPFMGCYGIGITRLVGTVVEVLGDLEKSKMTWPESIAPFKVHLIELSEGLGRDVYDQLSKVDHLTGEVLYDDRELSAGAKFADADLIGIPTRIVVSAKTLEQQSAEVTKGGVVELIKLSELVSQFSR